MSDASATPRVSIIVPSYRRADRLDRLVRSVAPQIAGRANREFIVVDDASDDPGYAALAARYSDIVRLVTQPRNAGPSAARNAGARIARGEYLIFIDDDCVAPPYWLDWFDSIIAHNPDADLIGGYARPLLHESRWTPTRWAPEQYLRLGIWYSDDDVVVLCSSCHLAVRRQWYERIGGFREAMRWAEDRNLTYRLRRAGAIIYTDPAWHVYHESEATLRQHLRRRVGYGRGAFEQIAREWPALDRDEWPAEGPLLRALGPRIAHQVQLLPRYLRRARAEKKWPPGFALMAAITPLAMDVGYIRARREHRRRTAGTIGTAPFGMINFGRSGSTVLGDMIHQCPGIAWGFELFNSDARRPTSDIGYERLRRRLAKRSTNRFGFEAVVDQIRALGMTPTQFVAAASRNGVGSWILLTRRNLLRQHVSAMLARETGRLHEVRSDFWRRILPRPIRLDVDGAAGGDLLDRFRTREADTVALRQALQDLPSIEIVYEDDIAADPRRAIARLSTFLKLPDYDPVVRYQPVDDAPLAELLANYDEVAGLLENTPYAWMLAD